MRLQKIPFRSTHAFSEFFLKYIEQDSKLKPFYSRFPSIASFKSAIPEKSKSFPQSSRIVLVEALESQYRNISKPPDKVKSNIQALLKKNTFTVTTGHQLSIFTGPLYFIYKIVTVINICKKLKSKYPKSNFVPVFWMASEDHDYEEIKSFRLNGKNYAWETPQKGAVGRFDPKDIGNLLSQLPGDVSIFREAYLKSKSLGDAVRVYVNALFGSEGIVVVDGDDRKLKTLFQKVAREDLFANTPNKLVQETNERLASLGFDPQVNPREINLFYLDNNIRARIEKAGNGFRVVDSGLSFTKEEIEKIVNEEPEKLSPNVILRPLYQEIILPNLAYVGGPAELVYWLQLKSVFSFFNVPFPILLPRNFALLVDAATGRKLDKTDLEVQLFFEEKNFLFNHWVSQNSKNNLTLGPELKAFDKQFAEIRRRSTAVDPTLSMMVNAEGKRMQNALEKIEKKMLRAEKRRHTDRLRQIEAVKDALFPDGSLQERTDNFLNFYQQDKEFIRKLIKSFDPFRFQFNVLTGL